MPTRAAAARIGVNVPKFFRLAVKHGVAPVLEAPGKRGAKFWRISDIDQMAQREAEAAA